MRAHVDHLQQWLAAFTQPMQREGEQDRDQQHLQDFAFRKGADKGVGDDVQQVIDKAHLGGFFGIGGDARRIQRGRVDVHPHAGLPDVDDDQTHDQGDGGHHLEIDQRLDADAADLLHVLHTGDAVDDRAEDDRCDQHLDQPDEAVPQRFQLLAGLGVEIADQHAKRDGTQNLNVKMTIPGA